MALDCTVTLTPGLSDFFDMVRTVPLEHTVAHLLEKYGEKVGPIEAPSGSSDVGNVSYRCPAIQPLIAVTEKNMALHTVDFRNACRTDRAHQAMLSGAAVLTELFLKVYNEPDFAQNVQETWKASLNQKKG